MPRTTSVFARLLLIALALVAAGRPAARLHAAVRAPITRTVYVTATARDGTPVTDLKAQEFVVKEDGKTRDVVEVMPATAPLSVSFIVADNGTGYFQRPVAQCIQNLLGKGEFSINVVEGPLLRLVDFTKDVQALRNAIGGLGRRASPRSESQMLEGIYNVADAFVKRKAERPVIIVLAYETYEIKNVQSDYVLTRLRDSGAALHVIAEAGRQQAIATADTAGAGRGGGGRSGAPVAGGAGDGTGIGGRAGTQGPGWPELMKTLGDGPGRTGGRREDIVEVQGQLPVLEQITNELLHQYRVSYVLPDGIKPNERLSVSVTRKNVDVRAPSRVPVLVP
jgi:hypothetical protein